jgi:hypothetical protein
MLFKYLKESKKLDIDNIDISSISFAMTIHSLIDYELDQKMTGQKSDKDLIDNYIKWFCKEK